MAEKLTNVVEHERTGMVISLHGSWGTGKTFFLTRWQKHLDEQEFKSLYFNAWEDEFCGEPFVSILSRLSDFSEDKKLASLARKYQSQVLPLLLQNIESVAKDKIGVSLAIKTEPPIQLYEERIKLKKRVKHELERIAARVYEDTKKPLIFIVDELDRCKPTYSIDFLEKIVHVFQVPNMVFVFGINKEELLNSLESLYGNIDSKVYLRRFFQKEYVMPPSNLSEFCNHLVVSTGLDKEFAQYGQAQKENLSDFVKSFTAIAGKLKLSLRDIEYCFRVVELIAKNLDKYSAIHPCFLAVLVPLSLVNNSLYKRLVEGEHIGAKVVDYLDEMVDHTRADPVLSLSLDLAEVYLYSTYSDQPMDHNPAFEQLQLLANRKDLSKPSFLSVRTQKSSAERAQSLLKYAHDLLYSNYRSPHALKVVSSLIELVGR